MNSVANKNLIESNIKALDEGLELLASIKQEHFTHSCKPTFHSTIGAHFRHVLEHYRCIVSQIEQSEVNYDLRERDQLLECDLSYAVSALQELRTAISNLNDQAFAKSYTILDQQVGTPINTSLERELLFLQSHTLHHYAMIGGMVRILGMNTDADFGVAIATRVHEQENASNTLIGDASPCAQ